MVDLLDLIVRVRWLHDHIRAVQLDDAGLQRGSRRGDSNRARCNRTTLLQAVAEIRQRPMKARNAVMSK